MPTEIQYCLDGKILPDHEAKVAVDNRAFRYGDSLFESISVKNGQMAFAGKHFSRLKNGLEILGISPQSGMDALIAEIRENVGKLMRTNNVIAAGKIRIQVYRKGGGLYFPSSNEAGYVIEAHSITHEPISNEAPVKILSFREISLQYSKLSAVKSGNKLHHILAAKFAIENGFDDALLYNDSFAVETTASNFFLVKSGKVSTPPITSGCLPGVMREVIIETCNHSDILIQEVEINQKTIEDADEAFLTNAIRGIVSVARIDNMHFRPDDYAVVPRLKKLLTSE